MKLELIANAGDEPVAILARVTSARQDALVANLADRLFAQETITYDAELSYRWGVVVHGTAEFKAWWRGRDGAPPAADRIFLEVHADA